MDTNPAQDGKNPENTPPGGLTASQWEAIRSIRPVGETPVPTHVSQRPASIYTAEGRYRQESDGLFKKVPLPITVSAQLPQPGLSMAHDGYGIPLLVTRDRAGKAHVFLNACRHRGSKLQESCDPVSSGRIVCPYHAWTYALDGKLIGIARAETFEGLKKHELGLIELPSFEGAGFVWAHIDPKATATPVEGFAQLAADLEGFGLPSMYVYGKRTYDLPANWKLVYEPFLEGYHVQRLHGSSIAKLFADVPTRITFLGRNIRQTSGKAGFDPSVLDQGVENLHRHITHAYQLFPNAIFITSPYYFTVIIVMPRSAGRTIVDLYMLVKSAPDNPKAEDLYARSFALAQDVFGNEDFRAAMLQQEAMSPGLLDRVYYGGLEEAIEPFHINIEDYIGKPN
jgi:phenylpropionate dioxygenase-like ring-hydroxylating dioxygenase large terminal subunit